MFAAQDAGQAARDFKVRQGALENANANPIDQTVRMIEISRMFELNQRAIRLQDETLQQAVSQIGRI
ncbi:MAG TPA: flagellar basal body rod C-terminal domain-containing protein [Candidatus Glassbacteria bacterium]|nr:flagellar basal body rod C-terminal domain-containing protein [Candidatus Glassbacteria bacterium]